MTRLGKLSEKHGVLLKKAISAFQKNPWGHPIDMPIHDNINTLIVLKNAISYLFLIQIFY